MQRAFQNGCALYLIELWYKGTSSGQLVRHAQDPLTPHPVLFLFGTCAHPHLCMGCQKRIPCKVCYTCVHVSIKHDVSAAGGEVVCLLNRKLILPSSRKEMMPLL